MTTFSPATVDPDLVAMLDDVFGRQAGSPPGTLDRAFWRTVDALGVARLTQSEHTGGSGAGWPEAAAVLTAAARHAVSVPYAEHDLLAHWLAGETGLVLDPGAVCTAAVLDESGTAHDVAWAAQADQLAVLWPDGERWWAAVVSAGLAAVSPNHNVAGEPRDTVSVSLDHLRSVASDAPPSLARTFRLRGALARAVQLTAASAAVVDLCVGYARDRVQFGRPLAKFQAVQHLVAEAASEVELARAATDVAVKSAAGRSAPAEFAVATARSCAGRAGQIAVRHGHQIHGAIGTTAEHRLHRYTLPITAWRTEFGSQRDWDQTLTAHAIAAGTEGLWPLLTGAAPTKATA
ncbi:MAG TPA: acyl-CoA dehydrogenase family protein [Amycolatopsis sp.]|nr:acyl-CoA dehydrogenase family protein [Amycolatopsis sp.]